MSRRPLTLLFALLAALLLPATGAFASGEAVLTDCGDDGKLSQRYSQSDYQQALRDLPADADSYTDCRDVIRDAQLAAARSGSGSSSSGGTTTGSSVGGASSYDPADPSAGAGGMSTDGLAGASEAEKQAIAQAVVAGQDEAQAAIAAKAVAPQRAGLGSLQGADEVPLPLVLVLVGLGLAGAGGAVLLTRRLVLARRPA